MTKEIKRQLTEKRHQREWRLKIETNDMVWKGQSICEGQENKTWKKLKCHLQLTGIGVDKQKRQQRENDTKLSNDSEVMTDRVKRQ